MYEGLSESSSTSVLCVCVRCTCARAPVCVCVFIFTYTLCMQSAKALARLRVCTGLPERPLLNNAISTKIPCPLLISYYMLQVYDKPVTLPNVLIE